jgi:uncharacterized phage-associated protein
MAEVGRVVELRRDTSGGTTVFDVAKGFLAIRSMDHKKLQKLCYYAYAWHLGLYNRRLFNERFQAWIHGPVQPKLYHEYRSYGWGPIPKVSARSVSLTKETKLFLRKVYSAYGHLTGEQLEALAHSETPWMLARGKLQDWEPSTKVIADQVITEWSRATLERNQSE